MIDLGRRIATPSFVRLAMTDTKQYSVIARKEVTKQSYPIHVIGYILVFK